MALSNAAQLNVQAGFSVINAAVQGWATHNTAKHEARMIDMNYNHNKSMVNEKLKVNQFIVGRNRLEILDRSAEDKLSISISEMQAKAEATVIQATYGQRGGSAQQVLHDISRSAAKAESTRLAALDPALFSNKLQLYQAGTQAIAATGIRPIDSYNANINIANVAGTALSNLRSIYSKT